MSLSRTFRRSRIARRALSIESLESRELLAADLKFSEIMYNPPAPTQQELALAPGTVAGDYEFVELQNVGDQSMNLAGATISVGITFNFSSGSINSVAPGEFVIVAKNITAFNARYGTGLPVAGVFGGALSNTDDNLVLKDGANVLLQDFTYRNSLANWPARADGPGASLEVKDFNGDFDSANTWRASREYLGNPNAIGIGGIDSLVINEVLTHTDLPQLDAIELYNPTAAPIDISHWWLSDSSNNYQKFRVPAGTIVPAGGYIYFDESDFNANPALPNTFRISSLSDDIWLMAGNAAGKVTLFIDDVSFPAAPNGESFGRWPNGAGGLSPMTAVTLGAANSGPRVGPLVISEIMFAPPDPDGVGPLLANDFEFIEIHNPTATAENMNQWQFTAGITFAFAATTTIPAQGTLVVVPFDPANVTLATNFRTYYGIDASVPLVGPFVGRLDNSGENVRLSRPDEPPAEQPTLYPLMIEDETRYRIDQGWPTDTVLSGKSVQRQSPTVWGDEPTNWFSNTPTPGVGFPHLVPNRAPTNISLAKSTVLVNQYGAEVGAVAVTDPDPLQTHTFTVNDARFEVADGKLRLKTNVFLAPDAPATIALQITAQDDGSPALQFTKAFTINVLANEFPHRNPVDRYDANNDGAITPLDALVIIIQLNATGQGELTVPRGYTPGGGVFLDADGNNFLSVTDPLAIIVKLNSGVGVQTEPLAAPLAADETPDDSATKLDRDASLDAAHAAALWSLLNEVADDEAERDPELLAAQ